MTPSVTRTACVGSGSTAGGPNTRPSRMSNDAPCSGHTRRVARKRPSHRRACAWVQMLSSANTPSRVWQSTISRPAITHARMLPNGSSASFSTVSNCAMALLKRDLGLEYRHGLPADPHAGEVGSHEFELDLHASRAVERVPLNAGKAGTLAVAGEQSEAREIGAEQPVGIAAYRILGDAERRAEHARLGQVVRSIGRQREYEVAGRADLCRQCGEPREIGLQVLERLGAAHPDQQPRTGRADDARRNGRIETLGGERQRIEHRQALAVVQLTPERGWAA